MYTHTIDATFHQNQHKKRLHKTCAFLSRRFLHVNDRTLEVKYSTVDRKTAEHRRAVEKS